MKSGRFDFAAANIEEGNRAMRLPVTVDSWFPRKRQVTIIPRFRSDDRRVKLKTKGDDFALMAELDQSGTQLWLAVSYSHLVVIRRLLVTCGL